MKIQRKVISIIMSVLILLNTSLMGFTQVYADGVAYDNPLFIPFTTLVTSALIGAGIIGKNAVDASNELVKAVSKRAQEKAIQKALEDNESPFRVVLNGQPEEPNDNNKNGKWFAIGATTALGTGLACEKGALEMILESAQELKAFDKMRGESDLWVSADAFKSQSTSSNIALQLANYDNRCVTMFDRCIHSDAWTTLLSNNGLSVDDMYYVCTFYVPNLNTVDLLPAMRINAIPKSLDLSTCYTPDYFKEYYNSKLDLKYYSIYKSSAVLKFRDSRGNDLNIGKYYTMTSNGRKVDQDITFSVSPRTTSNSNLSLPNGSYTDNAYVGYRWQSAQPYEFTQNVYNYNQTLEVQFPDWLQPTLEILGQQLQGIQIGIDSIQPSWQPTQEQVQSGEAPTNIINQYINYYENPTDIPADVEPEPEPEPEPEEEPATEIMVDEASQSLFDWALNKIELPDGFWEKLPFSIPYDMYLLIKAVLPSRSSGKRKLLKASLNSADSANGITISSYYDASAANVRSNTAVFEVPSKWSSNAPVINWDLHFQYTGVDGSKKQLDYVKTVDLSEYAYFAMIIYISIYVAWMGAILGFIFESFK